MRLKFKSAPRFFISFGLLLLVAWFASEACSLYPPTRPVMPPAPIECRDADGKPVSCPSKTTP